MSFSRNPPSDDKYKNSTGEDKPLDFSMNSSKEGNNKISVDEMKPKDQMKHVSSKSLTVRETASPNLQQMEKRLKQSENAIINNQKICNQTKDESKTTHPCNQGCTTMKHSAQEAQKNTFTSNNSSGSTVREGMPMPPLKQMPYSQFSSSERTNMASKLLKDIIQLQANQNAKAKLCLEEQINAFRGKELLEKHNTQNINEVKRRNSANSGNQNTAEYKPHITERSGVMVDVEMVDENVPNLPQHGLEENDEFIQNKEYRQAYNAGLFCPPNASNNQPLLSLSPTVMDTSTLPPDHRQGN